MKTAEEIIEYNLSGLSDFVDEQICLFYKDVIKECMNQLAIEVAREALKNASENVNVKVAGMGYIVIDKQSILDESNIPKL